MSLNILIIDLYSIYLVTKQKIFILFNQTSSLAQFYNVILFLIANNSFEFESNEGCIKLKKPSKDYFNLLLKMLAYEEYKRGIELLVKRPTKESDKIQ